MTSKLRATLLACTLALSTGCITDLQSVDYWSIVMPRCDYQVAGSGIALRDEELRKTTLRDECREALEEVLPFDSSFDQAPEGMKEHVLEAFQILAAYPLELPRQNRIFGASPGSIPSLHLCIIGAPGCPTGARPQNTNWQLGNYRKNIFNAVVNAFDSIGYDKKAKPDAIARNDFDLAAGINGRKLMITELFWRPTASAEVLFGKFARVGTLVHEAAHSEGYFHQICPDTGRTECDADLKGPYGFSVTYYELLMNGSGEFTLETGEPILSDYELLSIGLQSCLTLQQRVLNLPKDLQRLMDSTQCERINSRWIREKQNLERTNS